MQKPKTSTLLISLALFLFTSILFFPFNNLRGYIFSQIFTKTGILLVADDMSLTFFGWPGLILYNVNVTLPVAGGEMELSTEKLIFKIGVSSLFPPTPSISLNLKNLKKGGDLYVNMSQSAGLAKVQIDASDVNLAQIAVPGLGENIPGLVSAEGKMDINNLDFSKSIGSLEIKGKDLKVPHQVVGSPAQGFSFDIPAMTVDKFNINLNIRNGSLEFSNINLGTPTSDLRGSVTGDLKLGQRIEQSILNLTLKLQLSNKILQDPQAKTFTSFLEGYTLKTAGEYGMKWFASIQELTGMSYKILPEKIPLQ